MPKGSARNLRCRPIEGSLGTPAELFSGSGLRRVIDHVFGEADRLSRLGLDRSATWPKSGLWTVLQPCGNGVSSVLSVAHARDRRLSGRMAHAMRHP